MRVATNAQAIDVFRNLEVECPVCHRMISSTKHGMTFYQCTKEDEIYFRLACDRGHGVVAEIRID